MTAPQSSGGLRRKLIRSHLQIAWIGVGALVIVLAVLLWLRSRTLTLLEVRQPTVEATILARGGLQQSLASLQGWKSVNTDAAKQRMLAWDEVIDPAMERLAELSGRWTEADNNARLSSIEIALEDLREVQWWIEDASNSPGNDAARRLHAEKIVPIGKEVFAAISALILLEEPRISSPRSILRNLADFRAYFTHSEFSLTQYLIRTRVSQLADYERDAKIAKDRLATIEASIGDMTPEQVELLQWLSEEYRGFSNLAQRASNLRAQSENNSVSRTWMTSEALPTAAKIDGLLGELAASQQQLMQAEKVRVESLGNLAVMIGFVLIAILSFTAWMTARRNSKQLMEPISSLVTATQMLADGDLHQNIPVVSDDELGDLTHSFNEMRAKVEAHEADLLRSNEELQHFAYVASHDLQAPLRSISGFIQLLLQSHADRLDERGVDWIKRILNATTNMKTLIEDLLGYSRIDSQAKAFAPVDFAEIAQQALDMQQAALDEAEAEVEVGELPKLNADSSQILQLLQNLIGNGIKYQAVDSIPKIHVSAKDKGEMWEFSVRDNGIGIAEEYRERVFEVFRRLHKSNSEYQGTGIGLAVCRRVVERHGGKIWVAEPPQEGGSDFRFTIAANLPSSEAVETEQK